MKRIMKYLTIPFLALLLSACGGDGEGLFDTGSQKITVVDCNSSGYTGVQNNDLLVKDTDNTSVKIVHDSNGTKQVCVLTGSAHLVREN